MPNYSKLILSSVTGRSRLPRTPFPTIRKLGLDAPALELMTDFYRSPAISVPADLQIDAALDRMIYSGVRLLFVVGSDFEVLGDITSYDIQGEKPMHYLQSQDCTINTCSRTDISVQNIMTPVSTWHVLRYESLEHAAVGDIVETFKNLRQRHLVVMQTRKDGVQTVRGLFAASTLESALGHPVDIDDTVSSFSDIERALAT